MIAWNLIKHAFGMLWRNLGAAAKISLIPFAAMMLFYTLFFVAFFASSAGMNGPSSGMTFVGLPLMFVVGIALSTAVAVNWHRFVLLNEPAGWIPQVHGGRIVSYFLRAILISIGYGIIVGVAMAPAMAASRMHGVAGLLGILLSLALLVFALAASWRLSASLPGAALENGAGIGDTWRATEGTLGTFLLVTLLLVVLGALLGLLLGVLTLIPVIGILIYVVMQWFLTMFTLSLLTTVYGYYIEKRELV